VRAETVEKIFQTLGSYQADPNVNSEGTWGALSCPLAPWTHKGSGLDRNPSMMVSLEPGRSHAKCLSCGHSSGVLGVANEVHRYGGIDDETLDELRYFILLEESHHYEMLKKEGFRPELPATMIQDLGVWHPYWGDRGISKQEVRLWQLGYSGEERRALIPFWGQDGSLLGVVGRDVTGLSKAKYKVYPTGFQRADHVYGEHRITGNEDILLVVEGYLDVVTVSRYLPEGMGVVGLGSALPSKAQIRRLAMYANSELIIGLDEDDTGQRGITRIRKELEGRIPISLLDYGDYKDADEAQENIGKILTSRRRMTWTPVLDRLQGMLQR